MSGARALLRQVPVPAGAGLARMLIERNLRTVRFAWLTVVSGFFEPVFYLFSMGVGVGSLVGTIRFNGADVPYAVWVAPALMASSAMNGAVYEAIFNVFFKLHRKHYASVLATRMGARDVALGEVGWALLRGLVYSSAFYLVLVLAGLVPSWWSLLAVPMCTLIGFAFGAVGMAVTTYLRSWQDQDYVQLALMPLFLFSATFYPLSTYPPWLQQVVRATPLYQGVAMLRDTMLGVIGPGVLLHVAYLVVMGLLGLAVAARRIERLMYE